MNDENEFKEKEINKIEEDKSKINKEINIIDNNNKINNENKIQNKNDKLFDFKINIKNEIKNNNDNKLNNEKDIIKPL